MEIIYILQCITQYTKQIIFHIEIFYNDIKRYGEYKIHNISKNSINLIQYWLKIQPANFHYQYNIHKKGERQVVGPLKQKTILYKQRQGYYIKNWAYCVKLHSKLAVQTILITPVICGW